MQLLAARAYAEQNKQMLAHRHQAEYYAWQGNLKGAIEQLEIASKAGDGDFYQASVVDTRLRTFRREVADQGKSVFGKQGLNVVAAPTSASLNAGPRALFPGASPQRPRFGERMLPDALPH